MPIITPGIPVQRRRTGVKANAPQTIPDRLSDLARVRDNPGNLRARYYLPAGLKASAPLVVVLHGCTQNAAIYDHGSGWSTLAERHGFILLFPEQQRANNPMLCFNWFAANDSQRGMGEAASIRAMIEAMKRAHDIDPGRVFVTGLSAGGAMASVMLATYPELFAGGAILAGVAYGCAESVGGAFDCMSGRGQSDAAELARNVLRASPHKGPWPRVQAWHGSADHTVVASNADAIVRQWSQLHGLPAEPNRVDEVAGYPRRAWISSRGETLVEHYSITGEAHGVPLAGGEDAIGAAGAHMLDVGLSSTARIAAFFGIAPEEQAALARAPRRHATPPQEQASGPQAVIEKALKVAGLLR